MIIMLEVIYAFGVLLIGCELGQRVNIAFEECSEMIDQFEWYLFSAKIRTILPFIISYTQQPVYLKCFGSTPCDRGTFKSVRINSNILNSSFMVILAIISDNQYGILIFHSATSIV